MLADNGEYVKAGGAWIAGKAALLQMDTTNSVILSRRQIGIGKITGAAAAGIEETITFPVPFSGVPVVEVNFMGNKATAAFDPTGLTDNTTVWANGQAVSASSFKAYLRIFTGNLVVGQDYYYSWTAEGPA